MWSLLTCQCSVLYVLYTFCMTNAVNGAYEGNTMRQNLQSQFIGCNSSQPHHFQAQSSAPAIPQRFNYAPSIPSSPQGVPYLPSPRPRPPNYMFMNEDRSVINTIPTSNSINRLNTMNGDQRLGFVNLDHVVRFRLYTRETTKYGQELRVDNHELLSFSKFLPSHPTKIILHGFADGEVADEWTKMLTDAYLTVSDVNIIVVDYSYFAGFLFFWTNLPLFASGRLVEMIRFLEKNGAPLDSIHIIGRSFGAHIGGMAGRALNSNIGRITGLQPAGPLYNFVSHEHRLDYTDAAFVDIIHINGKRFFFHGARFGLTPPTGHVDIYPNIAEKGNGCPDDSNPLNSYSFRNCRTGRGVRYFIDSIRDPNSHSMCFCESFERYKSADCRCGEENANIRMSEINNQTIGIFQLAASPSLNLQLRRGYSLPIWG